MLIEIFKFVIRSHAMYEIGNYKFSLKYMGKEKSYSEMVLLFGMPKNEWRRGQYLEVKTIFKD